MPRFWTKCHAAWIPYHTIHPKKTRVCLQLHFMLHTNSGVTQLYAHNSTMDILNRKPQNSVDTLPLI